MNYIWVLLFGSSVALTEKPIDLAIGVNEIPISKPVSAITHGASLLINVSSMLPRDGLTLTGSQKWIENHIKPGCLKATLEGKQPSPVFLEFRGNSSFEPGKVYLILANSNGVPVRQDFGKLSLTSCMPINQILIYWKNYQK